MPGGGRVCGDDLPPPPATGAQGSPAAADRAARALTLTEHEAAPEVLHTERFVDVSPEETYATLLDEGTYLGSTRTIYRILEAKHAGVRERRAQLTHPAYAKPERSPSARTSCGPGTI